MAKKKDSGLVQDALIPDEMSPLGLYDNLHDSLATFEESAPDYPDLDDDADETDGGEAVDPNTGEIK